MTRDEAIVRLCALMSRVCDEVYAYSHAADCICTGRPPLNGRYQNDGECIAFIEAAVEAAIRNRDDHDTGRLR